MAGAARRARCAATTCTASGSIARSTLARGGDQRYVASPRVDSYHSVWFELHEDLIRLSGKKRAEATSG